MSRWSRWWGVVAVVVAVIAAPAWAERSSAGHLLEAITARIRVENTATGHDGLCHGLVSVVRSQWAYVATAKHCVEELTSAPLRGNLAVGDLALDMTVEYANGTVGRAEHLAWNQDRDALIMVATYTRPPASYAGLCADCTVYQSFGSGQRIPVLSILSAGGGSPVVSSGFVMSDSEGHYVVVLPVSLGTSGSGVVDARGNLVGIVVTAGTSGGADAGSEAGIVPGQTVDDLVKYAIDTFEK